ncbi:hypothetical protein [Escherichia coli]
MAKVIIEIKNTVSGTKGRHLRTSIAVGGSVTEMAVEKTCH